MERQKNFTTHPAPQSISLGPKEHEESSPTSSFPSSSSASLAGIHPPSPELSVSVIGIQSSDLISGPAGISVHPQLSIPAGISGTVVLSAPTTHFPTITNLSGFVPVLTFTRVSASHVDTPSAKVVSASDFNTRLTTTTTKRPQTPPRALVTKKARKNPKPTTFTNKVNSRSLDGPPQVPKADSRTITRSPRGWHKKRVVRDLLPALPEAVVGEGFGQIEGDAGDIGWGIGGKVAGEIFGDLPGDVRGDVAGEFGEEVAGEFEGEFVAPFAGGVAEEIAGENAGEIMGQFAREVAEGVARGYVGGFAGEFAGELVGQFAGDVGGGVAGEASEEYGEPYGEQFGEGFGEGFGQAHGDECGWVYGLYGERLPIYREAIWRGFL